MPYTDAILKDLCVACADATDLQMRGTAHRLLCHELASRLRASAIDSNVLGTHPAFLDDAVADFAVAAGVQLETRKGGTDAALFYFAQPGVWNVAAPHSPSGDYPSILQGLLSEATRLSEAFRDSDGSQYADATRFRVRGAAAAGDDFTTEPMFQGATASSEILLLNGTWHVEFTGTVRSEASAPGAIIGFSFALDGVDVADRLIGRAIATDGDDIDIVMTFDTTDLLLAASDSTLTIWNSSSSPQFLDGLIRFYPSE